VLKVYEQTLDGATAVSPLGLDVKESIKFSMNDNCDAIFKAAKTVLVNPRSRAAATSTCSGTSRRRSSSSQATCLMLSEVLMKKLGEKWSMLEPTVWEWFHKENTGKVKGNWQRNIGYGVPRDNNALES